MELSGTTYIEINYDRQWVDNSLAGIQGFSWLYEWGMYIFLIATLAILVWIFFDSITKKKDQKALVPRILSIVGFFAIIPAFIFRYTGNADGVVTLVRLNAETGTPYYAGPLNWNVNWLVNGYGTPIAVIALLGMVISIVALVIYASTVQRSKPSTEFVQAFNSQMSSLESKVEGARREAAAANAAANSSVNVSNLQASSLSGIAASAKGATSNTAATIIDRKPQAATIIDRPQSGFALTVQSGSSVGNTYNLPIKDLMIGREMQNDIVLDDGKASREHARLVFDSGMWIITDLGSVNGTFLNGRKVIGQQSLTNGDKIKIGDTLLVFTQLN